MELRPLYRAKSFLKILKSVYEIVVAREKKMIFLFGSPGHSNMGDQAQTYCLLNWFKMNYPGYGVHIFRLSESRDILLKLVRKTIKPQDKIVCHSGYHLTDLYHEQDVYCKLANMFRERPIWIFPQTIYYKDSKNLIKTAEIINSHGNITLMVRDNQSFETAKQYFNKCNLILFPDIVTSLIGTKTFSHERNGVLFCFRNDKEAFYSEEQIDALRKKFGTIKTERTDTTLQLSSSYIIKNREMILNEQLVYYSKFQLIITDRYHGTIFSLIAGTPVIVLKTTDHKLSSGVKWFPQDFKDYIEFVENIDSVYDTAQEILSKKLTHQLPPYFKQNYYDKLKKILENEGSGIV